MASARKHPGNTPGTAVAEKVIDPKGLKKFSQEADKELGQSGGKISRKLGEQASEGSLPCARLLVELAERRVVKRRVTQRKKSEPSLAERLAEEPEWSGEAGDEQPF